MINKILYNNFCWNEQKEVIKILSTCSNIDVFYKNGIFFEFALSKGNIDICNALLNYFENKQFLIKNKAYEEGKTKLTEILENITDEMKLASEMKKVLSPYIDFEDSVDSREHDFDEVDLQFLQLPISFENDQNHEITTSGNTIEYNHYNTEII